MAAGLFDGLMSGFFSAKQGYEAQQREDDQARSAKEGAIF